MIGSKIVSVGVVPYLSTYDTKDQARRHGYWIPGAPVKARIIDVKRDRKFGIHLINAYLYDFTLWIKYIVVVKTISFENNHIVL